MKNHLKVLVYYHIPEYLKRYEKLLKTPRKDVQFVFCYNKKQIEEHIQEADVIFSGHTFPVDLLPKAKNLKWIQSMSAGVENFVLSKVIPSHVILSKIKGVHGPLMSEYVLGYILAITLKMKKAFENQQKRGWPYYVPDTIRNKTAGIMGLGSVGAHIAYRLHLVGIHIIGFDEEEKNLPFISQQYSSLEIDEFLKSSDFVVMVLPLSQRTKGILGEKEFAKMKKSAYLLNISRGPLVQEKALIKALKERQIAGAVLDVFNEEPLPKDHEIWKLPNVTITPHISGPSIPEDIAEIFLKNLRRFEKNENIIGVVDFQRGY